MRQIDEEAGELTVYPAVPWNVLPSFRNFYTPHTGRSAPKTSLLGKAQIGSPCAAGKDAVLTVCEGEVPLCRNQLFVLFFSVDRRMRAPLQKTSQICRGQRINMFSNLTIMLPDEGKVALTFGALKIVGVRSSFAPWRLRTNRSSTRFPFLDRLTS